MQRSTRRLALFTFLVAALASGAVRAQTKACRASGEVGQLPKMPGLQPLVLFTEFNPWAMLVGGDTPTFALYVDGTVIFWSGDGRAGRYLSTRLTAPELASFSQELEEQQLSAVCPYYSLTQWTDQTTNRIVFQVHNGYKIIEVYGSLRADHPAETGSDQLPPQLRRFLEKLIGFKSESAKPWLPPFFEVVLWPFDYAKGKPAIWPADLPDLTDSKTVKHGDRYSVYIPIEKLDEWKSFSSKMTEKQAILLGGKKWTSSTRFPFPHEISPASGRSNAPAFRPTKRASQPAALFAPGPSQ
jgi:hypothetical protein